MPGVVDQVWQRLGKRIQMTVSISMKIYKKKILLAWSMSIQTDRRLQGWRAAILEQILKILHYSRSLLSRTVPVNSSRLKSISTPSISRGDLCSFTGRRMNVCPSRFLIPTSLSCRASSGSHHKCFVITFIDDIFFMFRVSSQEDFRKFTLCFFTPFKFKRM